MHLRSISYWGTAMNTLYDSDTYSVTHMLANAEPEGQERPTSERYPQGIPVLARHGF